jgi:hypothetical protein
MRRHPTAPVNVARISVTTSGTDFTAPERSELRTGWPVSSRTRDMVPSPHALSRISPSNFLFSIRA